LIDFERDCLYWCEKTKYDKAVHEGSLKESAYLLELPILRRRRHDALLDVDSSTGRFPDHLVRTSALVTFVFVAGRKSTRDVVIRGF